MKTVIVYGSHHHGNTKKVVQRLADVCGVELIDAEVTADADISGYDTVGFASGIEFGKLFPVVTGYGRQLRPEQKVFAVYTCGKDSPKYGDDVRKIAEERGCEFLGKFSCKGYDTYGPLKLIGGLNKDHPNEADLEAAVKFFEKTGE